MILMRTRRVKEVNLQEELEFELFELEYGDKTNTYYKERNKENCAYSSDCAEECKNPFMCKKFQFKQGHEFAIYNEVL